MERILFNLILFLVISVEGMNKSTTSAHPSYEISVITDDYIIFTRSDRRHSQEYPHASISFNKIPNNATEAEFTKFYTESWNDDRNLQWLTEYFKYLRLCTLLNGNQLKKLHNTAMLNQQSKLLAERLRKKERKSSKELHDFQILSKLDLPNPHIIEYLKKQ